MKSGPLLSIKLRWPSNVFLTGLLIFSCFCSAIRIEIGSIGISLTHLFMPVVLLYLILHFNTQGSRIPIYVDNASALLFFVWFVSLISTVLYSGLPTRSITGIINFTSFVGLFIMAQWIMLSIDPNKLINTLFRATKISAYIGLGCLIIALITNETNIGATFDHISQQNIAVISKPIPSIRSLSIEPNLFGIITATVLSMLFAAYLTGNKSKIVLHGMLLLGLALILSYTRSAFIGLAIAIFIMAAVSKKWSAISRVLQFGILIISILAILLIALPDDSSFKKAIAYKMGSGIFDVSAGTAIPRVISFHESINGFVKRPIIGNGIFSANNVFVNPHTHEVTGTAGPIGWLNGLFIQALHDTGAIGLLGWLFFFFFMLNSNYKIYNRVLGSFEKSIFLGFIGGNLVILVGSQASSVVWIGFPFIYWAINLTILRYYRNQLKTQMK